MKPYIVKLLELAHAARKTAAIHAERGNPEQAAKARADALEHLNEAARQVRADSEDAAGARDKLTAAHDHQALVRVVALLGPTDEAERAEWIAAADPNGPACATVFGPPDRDTREELAQALGLPSQREIDTAQADVRYLRDQLAKAEYKLKHGDSSTPTLPLSG